MGDNNGDKGSQAGQLYENFVQALTFRGTLQAFHILCRQLDLDPLDHRMFYSTLKSKLNTWRAKALWSKLDKRSSHKEYKKGEACPNTQCLIIGAGPCGLRTAIELALLGCKVVVLEKRETFARNNVLHLWPSTIHDLRALGAKKFHGKFCAGAIDHISIRQLQLILVKVALLLGVEVHANLGFVQLLEPPEDQETQGIGWRAELHPKDHPISQFTFDIIIGADGRKKTLQGFRRKEFRGKLAIAITANFINRNTTAEAKVEEISGVAFIFNQKFFQDLKEDTGIDLENIVYYKDNTHYFVMTAKKQSLLDKGVIVNDYVDTEMLLSGENVNQEALLSYAREAADFATNYQLPALDFAVNHNDQPDVAMFDFTCMYASENASLVRERWGHRLLVALVGDSLLEPFWPMGTGCARGFLAAMDTAWMVKRWAEKVSTLEILAERESIYRLLPQTTTENISKNFEQYTIDPASRYPNLNSNCVASHQVRQLYITTDLKSCPLERVNSIRKSIKVSRRDSEIRPNRLLTWCQKQTESYQNVTISDLTSSWHSGLALCAIIHHFCPQLIDFDLLNEEDAAKNNQLAFDIAEQEFGISPVTTGKEMASAGGPDKLSMVMYLSKFYEHFRGNASSAVSVFKLRKEGSNDVSALQPRQSNSLCNVINLLPRKRTPKEKKSEEKDAASKRRRRTTTDWQDVLSARGEGKEASVCTNNNKVKSMASQLLAKFEENAAGTSLQRQVTAPSSAPRPVSPVPAGCSVNARFLTSRGDQAGSDHRTRTSRQSDLVASAEQVIRDAKFVKEAERQAGVGKHVPVIPHNALVLSGVLQRLQRLEEKLEQRKALSLAQGDVPFSRKSIKERGAHLTALFGARTLRQQSGLPDSTSSHAVAGAASSTHGSALSMSPVVPHLLHPPTQIRDIREAAINLERMFLGGKDESNVQDKARVEIPSSGSPGLCPRSESVSPRSTVSAQHCHREMTVGKVSTVIGDMAEILVKLYRTDHRPNAAVAPQVQGSMKKDFPQNLGGSDICYFCKKRVYVMERLSADGKFFHRECFKCEFCATTLRLGAYAFSVEEGKFYCKPHFTYCKLNNKARKRRNLLSTQTYNKGEAGSTTSSDGEAVTSSECAQAAGAAAEASPVSLVRSASVGTKRSKRAPGHVDLPATPPGQESGRALGGTGANMLAVRVMVASDDSGSDVEMEAAHTPTVLDTSGPGGSMAGPMGPGHRGSESQVEEEAEPGSPYTTSTPQEALRRAKSFQSPAMDRQEKWRKKLCNKLPLLLRKKMEQAGREGAVNSPTSPEIQEHPSQVRSHLTRGYSLPHRSPRQQRAEEGDAVCRPRLGTDSTAQLTTGRLRPAAASRSPRTVHKLSCWSGSEPAENRRSETLVPDATWSGDPGPSEAAAGLGDLSRPSPTSARGESRGDTPSPRAPSHPLGWSPPHTGHRSMETDLEDGGAMQTESDAAEMLLPDPGRQHPAMSSVLSPPAISIRSDQSGPLDSPTMEGAHTKSPGPESPGSPLTFLVNAFRKSFFESKSPVLPNAVEQPQEKKSKTRWARTFSSSSFHGLSLGASLAPSDGHWLRAVRPRSPFPPRDKGSPSEPPASPRPGLFPNSPKPSGSVDGTGASLGKGSHRSNRKEKDKDGQASPSALDDAGEGTSKGDIRRLMTSFKRKSVRHKELKKSIAKVFTPPTLQAAYGLSPPLGPEDQLVGSQFTEDESESSLDEPSEGKQKATRRRKVQDTALLQLKKEEVKRLHRAQIIQRQLQEVEEKQRVLEERGVLLEKVLRGESEFDSKDEPQLMQKWFKLVMEKNVLVCYEAQMMIFARELELEDHQSRLQQLLHSRMSVEDFRKTEKEIAEEKQMLSEMLEVIEQRDKLVALLEEQRQQEKEENRDLESWMLARGYKFNWS
ncbi:F-actin-monooxygenase MICAL2-like isoform X1 [Leucoraja erinacea]|uniref:F-actin-monooxygenase MICAL2-like isoform X1 n=1 Tax=Leucoraja erinaceus TaxID=7782 RepID=UPI00245828E0|nr:F-actin-monooxygenase MICAL2-like isoform X1 [Leucoraja erinacea]